MAPDLGIFHCVVLTPQAKVLECKTHSVVLPAHDGQIGIWRNHMPMLVELGLGIVEIKAAVTEADEKPTDRFLLVEEGFARISNNVVTIMAYEVTAAGEKKTINVRQSSSAVEELTARQSRKASLLDQLEKLAASKANTAS